MQESTKLETVLLSKAVLSRPMSIKANAVQWHAADEDLNVNEFDFDCDGASIAFGESQSLSDILSSTVSGQHLRNPNNFSHPGSEIDCLRIDESFQGWQTLGHSALKSLLDLTTVIKDDQCALPRTLLAFFITLSPESNTSYGCQASISEASFALLQEKLGIQGSCLLNMLGRPDYWAPKKRTSLRHDGSVAEYALSIQYPRWNIKVQGSPVSAWMKHDVTHNATYYLIAHKADDTSVNMLKKIFNKGLEQTAKSEICSMVSSDSCGIKYLRKVDEHFSGSAPLMEKGSLDVLTKDLQVVSFNASTHIANAEIAMMNAAALEQLHAQVVVGAGTDGPAPMTRQQANADNVVYVRESMEKQKMWFVSYKSRKDTTMGLVFNLVTQQDAANNFKIARAMRQDSRSMNVIAALTMIFLPGTFTATMLGAGIFSAAAREENGPRVSSLWWFWCAITIPLTFGILLAWYLYQKKQMSRQLHKEMNQNQQFPPGAGRSACPSEGKTSPSRGSSSQDTFGWIRLTRRRNKGAPHQPILVC